MKNILEPWRKFLVEQEQPKEDKFSLEKVKPVLMNIYDNAFKRVERANFEEKAPAKKASEYFLNNKVDPRTNGMYNRYEEELKKIGGISKGKGQPYASMVSYDTNFLKWVYFTYMASVISDAKRAIGAVNIWYYNHKTGIINPVRLTKARNPDLLFTSDGSGGLAITPDNAKLSKAAFGSSYNILRDVMKKRGKAVGAAIVGLNKFDDIEKSIVVAAEELDHIFDEFLRTKVEDKAVREKEGTVFRGTPLVPLQKVSAKARDLINKFWAQSPARSSAAKAYNAKLGLEPGDRKAYGVGKDKTLGYMLDYINLTGETKATIQYVLEKMADEVVDGINDLCKDIELRIDIEQQDDSFKSSMLIPALCQNTVNARELRMQLDKYYKKRFFKK
tara:strand:- start:65 stop:1231 length:1167 start_codon:yes stop_codon:yes gene_type:complete